MRRHFARSLAGITVMLAMPPMFARRDRCGDGETTEVEERTSGAPRPLAVYRFAKSITLVRSATRPGVADLAGW
jgi:hypothetical protein